MDLLQRTFRIKKDDYLKGLKEQVEEMPNFYRESFDILLQ